VADDRASSTDSPLSYNATLVLQAMTQGHRYGFQIMRATGLPSGTVYPLLRRLEGSEMVTSRWEDAEVARDEGRPPRRYYEPTREGVRALAEARERILAQQALFGDPTPAEGGGS
jgi:DNA-binding PadR family transcriptional regulator